ncbi:MAG TPA: carboxypeptidase-like regulatory domain-containing protein, partial [Spirochaetia bacterium]|nr:carboxypeptidase-like regulatory domain-containing protein [Spirochaetia bacterium]
GNFQFSGIIWHTYFSQFGKTADRIEIYLLVYHPDYGLVKNENPYFIVSDVTTELPVMEIEDIWNKGTIFGKVLNWKDGSPLANASIAVYVPDSWSYSGGSVSDSSLVFPDSPTYTTTTDTDGTWSLTVRYKKMPGRSDTVNKTKVLITWPRLDWRAEDPVEGSPPGTSINNGLVYGDRDINKNGRNALQGDNNDWYILSPEIQANGQPVDTGTVTLQRWRFRSTVSGRIVNNSTGQGISGVMITLTVPDGGTKSYTVTSSPQSTQTGLEDGFFNFGELVWEIGDITNLADKKTGKVPVAWSIASPFTYDSGAPSNLIPDQNPFIVIKVH